MVWSVYVLEHRRDERGTVLQSYGGLGLIVICKDLFERWER
jgi:hypothetical protein